MSHMAKKSTAKKPAAKQSSAKDATVIYRRVSIDDVIEDPANARKHGDVNLKSIETSLRLYGQVEPLVVQRSTMKVIGGNGRLKVMRKLGWTEVDIADTEIDNAGAAALGIVLNRTAELAEWNNDVLDSVLREIDTGDEELQALLSQLAEDEKLVTDSQGDAEESESGKVSTLAERFVVPPFSVLDARQGYWQERKRAWLSLGIKSELGRGGGRLD